MAHKITVRNEIRKKIAALRDEERRLQSEKLCGSLMSSPHWQESSVLLGFYPFRFEIDIKPLLELALQTGRELYLPRIGKIGQMEFHRTLSLEDLVPNSMGIKEPEASAPLWQGSRDKKSLMLLPGLLFDNRGNRIGWGGGFYDRWLSGHKEDDLFPFTLIGVGYNLQLVPELHPDPWDIPLNEVAIPKKIILCN